MLPKEFLENMRALLGSEFEALYKSMSAPNVAALRINRLRPEAERAFSRFADGRVPWEECGYYVKEGAQPGKSLEHFAGAFYLQDASAMAPVAALDPRPGETVLDLCAAPGGKSTQIAGRMQGEGALVCNEYVKARAQILKGNLERMGVGNAFVTSASAEAFAALGERFDAILVDAPCSGEGMFRRDPAAIGEWSPGAPEICAARQAGILDSAAKCLKPGGRLVYSTCTFNETENEGTIRAFLKRNPAFAPEGFQLEGIGKSKGGCLRLWPHWLRGEGHFVCRMRKAGQLATEVGYEYKQDKRVYQLAQEAGALCLRQLPRGEYIQQGDEIWLRAPLPFALKGIYVLSCGLHLASVKNRTIEPAHALAMSAGKEEFLRTLALDAGQAVRFVEGEALEIPCERGWTRVTYQGLPLGWGKSTGDMLKNHLPKGLRLRGGHALTE